MSDFDPAKSYAPKTYYLKIRWDWIKLQFLLIFFAYVLILMLWNKSSFGGDSADAALATALTTIEIALAVLAIVLALGAFFGFWMVRESAERAARSEAVACIEKQLPDLLTSELIARAIGSDPRLIAKIAREIDAVDFDIGDQSADEISGSFDGDMNDA